MGSDFIGSTSRGAECNFNPRSPHGERQPQFIIDSYIEIFQSTLPAWGATTNEIVIRGWIIIFQSTLPAGGATARNHYGNGYAYIISIHAPRRGSDNFMFSRSGSRSNFNPRSPHGERPVIEMNPASASRISIHAPRRGSDLQSDVGSALLGAISIHAPRRGSDRVVDNGQSVASTFQSTLPAGGATATNALTHP